MFHRAVWNTKLTRSLFRCLTGGIQGPAILFLILILVATLLPLPKAALAAGAITGTVFRDFNANGRQDANEVGQVGITMTAYDAANNVQGTATTVTNGAYTLNATGTGPYRIEFTAWPSYLQPSAYSMQNGTSVQFVADGNADNINFGLNYPAEFCQANPDLCTPIHVNGDTNTTVPTQALEKFPYSATGTMPVSTHIATKSQIGSTWGLAYNRTTKTIYSAAFLKRHAGLGPHGLGAIYATDINGTSTNLFVDMATLGVNVGMVPSNAARGLGVPNQPNNDPAAFPLVAKVGLGDIDISEDDKTLYVTSLNDKTLYAVNVSGPGGTPTLAGSFPLPNPNCTGGEFRPFALKVYHGGVYVGGVCDAQISQQKPDLSAHIYRFEPGSNTFTPVFTFPLNYPKGYSVFACPSSTGWFAWIDTFPAPCTNGGWAYPQPVLSDIEFDVDGSMILGFFDRFGHQTGEFNFTITNTTSIETYPGGDILRACLNGTGAYVLENNGSCGGATSSAGVSNNQGPGGGEFYFNDNFFNGHAETSNGGLALLPGSGEIALTAMDPFRIITGGVLWLSNNNGARTDGYEVYAQNALTLSGFFGKAHGLGDLEILCDAAPIEIGNRVWNDTNKNGIQDAGESPIAEVTVELIAANGAAVATAVTDANGAYYFSSAVGMSTGSAKYGLPLTTNTQYTVRIPTAQAPLAALAPTIANADSTANGDSRDSDGVVSGVYTQVTLTTGTAGANNHTYDFGFLTPATTPGRVEIDKFFCASNDGTRTEFEVFPPQASEPLARASRVATCETREGIAFTVKNSNGEVVANVITGLGGSVQFELPPGTYTLIEDTNGASTTFVVEANKLTAIFVRNFKSGEVKLVKFFCASGDPGTIISVNGLPQPPSQDRCTPGNAQFRIDGRPTFEVGSDGIRLFPLMAGLHTLVEVASGASADFTVTVDTITTIVVYNFPTPTPITTLAPTRWVPVPGGDGSTAVEIAFASSLKRETVENALTLIDAHGAAVAGETYPMVDFDSHMLVGVGFRPASPLNGNFTATLKGGAAGVQTNDGRTMGGDYQWSFTLTTPHTIFMPLVNR